ncbi:MAG: copper homeostasis protein CutC [Saprospiraceae bacterium]|nr:copper homeostasis protein CutC [Saprospiraceae bacterium]
MVTFELCCSNIHSVEVASIYNVDGIELCSNLSQGGITPSFSFIITARKIFNSELSLLIRARSGNFVYSGLEKKIMLDDIKVAADCGIDTLVFGSLNENKTLDEGFIEDVIAVSSGLKLCFHKAFDETDDIFHSLEILKNYQIDRLLTSGGKNTAIEACSVLNKLNEQSENKIEIMAGGSIRPENILPIIQTTGIRRIHAALRINDSFQIEEQVNLDLLKESVRIISEVKSQTTL